MLYGQLYSDSQWYNQGRNSRELHNDPGSTKVQSTNHSNMTLKVQSTDHIRSHIKTPGCFPWRQNIHSTCNWGKSWQHGLPPTIPVVLDSRFLPYCMPCGKKSPRVSSSTSYQKLLGCGGGAIAPPWLYHPLSLESRWFHGSQKIELGLHIYIYTDID